MACKVVVSTVGYEQLHGRKPRGYGLWYFRLPGGLTFSHPGTYGAALRVATVHARRIGESNLVRMQLCG